VGSSQAGSEELEVGLMEQASQRAVLAEPQERLVERQVYWMEQLRHQGRRHRHLGWMGPWMAEDP